NNVHFKVFRKNFHYFLRFIFAEQSMIHKNTCQLITNGFMNEGGNDRRINSAAKRTKYFAVTNLMLNIFNFRFNKLLNRPIPGSSTYVKHKVFQNLFATF